MKAQGPARTCNESKEAEEDGWLDQGPDMNSNHRVCWGWSWLFDAETATNDGLLPRAAPRV
jgi:hypothetical protein